MIKKYLAYVIAPLLFFTTTMPVELSQSGDERAQIEAILKPAKQTFVQAVFSLAPYAARYPSIITAHEWQELDLDALLKNIDRTHTCYGLWGLRQLLWPIANKQEIIKRQTVVQTILSDNNLRNSITAILDEMKLYEDDINAYWNIHDELQNNAASLYYALYQPCAQSINNLLNHSKYALESAALVELSKNTLGLVSSLCLGGISVEVVSAAAQNRPMNFMQGIRNGLQSPLRNHSWSPSVYTNGYRDGNVVEVLARGTAADEYMYLTGDSNSYAKKSLTLGAVILTKVAADVMWGMKINDIIKQLRFQYYTQSALQLRMTRIARFFVLLKDLRAILMREHMVDQACINSLAIESASPEAKKLTELLACSTFDQPHTYVYSRGNVLLAHKLLCDIKQQLIPVLQAVSMVDSYASLAQFYQESVDKNMPCSFVQFKLAAQPDLNLENMWTPLMPMDQAVGNSIVWNPATRNKIIITGPNGCGKSTIMKAAAHAIVMGQSFGLVPANNGAMSLFTGLRTGLMPRESLQENLSTFMAEKKRIDAIRTFIADHKQGHCVCVLLDEPYRGTVEAEAAHRVYQLGKELATADSCMLVMATHLEKPIALESETGVFANCQMGLDETVEGKFIRTFKLLPGAALWWFNDIDRRARFVDQLLQPAIL